MFSILSKKIQTKLENVFLKCKMFFFLAKNITFAKQNKCKGKKTNKWTPLFFVQNCALVQKN
jgi:hypothetical protein